MKFNPKPSQTFLILSMLFGQTPEEREPSFKKCALEQKLRNALVEEGFIRVEKRGRASHLVLTDEAWEFASEHLDAELPKTPRAARLLRAVFGRLRRSLETTEQSLAEFVTGEHASTNTELPSVGPTELQIRVAC